MRHLLPLVLAAASLLVPVAAGRAAGRNDLLDAIRRDAEAFLAFSNVRSDALREALGHADEASALAIARRLHAEECRFLDRVSWYCRQDRTLAEAADGLAAYLGSYRSLTAEGSLALRRDAQTGRSQVFRVAMSLVGSVAPRIHGAPLAPAAPVAAGSGPGYDHSEPDATLAGDPRLAGAAAALAGAADPGARAAPAEHLSGSGAATAGGPGGDSPRRSVAGTAPDARDSGEDPVRIVKRPAARKLDEVLPPSTPSAGGVSPAGAVPFDAGDPSAAYASGTFLPRARSGQSPPHPAGHPATASGRPAPPPARVPAPAHPAAAVPAP
jgi:hypothetical protein